jgi:asparagine synthase (glutamine-hydrolysing)
MLSGDGGDELFWGYPRYQKIVNSRNLFRIPSLRGRKVYSKLLDRKKELYSNKLSAVTLGEANLKHSQTSSHSEIEQVLGLNTEFRSINSAFELKSLKKATILQGLRQNDFYYFMQKVLTKVDRNSMSHGLEVRVPFLNLEMIRLAEQINPELAISHQIPKFITKEILKRYIPYNKIDQSKRGFTPPLLSWILIDFREEIEESLRAIDDLKIPINARNIYEEWAKILNQEVANINLIWAVYMLIIWKKNLDKINIKYC